MPTFWKKFKLLFVGFVFVSGCKKSEPVDHDLEFLKKRSGILAHFDIFGRVVLGRSRTLSNFEMGILPHPIYKFRGAFWTKNEVLEYSYAEFSGSAEAQYIIARSQNLTWKPSSDRLGELSVGSLAQRKVIRQAIAQKPAWFDFIQERDKRAYFYDEECEVCEKKAKSLGKETAIYSQYSNEYQKLKKIFKTPLSLPLLLTAKALTEDYYDAVRHL